MRLKISLTLALICLGLTGIFAQDEMPEIKSYVTAAITGEAPVIDGRLDDEAWDQVKWGGDFVQRFPTYGLEPSQQTQFKIIYDSKYLYVGIRAFDPEPEKIVKRMSRRDGFDGDWVEVNIDSYNDKRTAFSFTASVSGVKGDEYVTNNGDNWDSTWDPIWYLKTSVDDKGWIAEYKIPLSQLRFANIAEHTWGIQINRRCFRNEEMSFWQPIPQNAPGWVHLFGELKGIKGIKPQKQFEVQPYVVGSHERFQKVDGDPYRTGTNSTFNAGVDAKIGITSDITLDLTVNPDFGQVEADPSAVNLSAFRLFFREQRPFFLEGNNLFNFRLSGGPNNLFYSRRIGGPAHGYPEDGDIAYIDRTPPTRILGAAKITGKNAKGFSWGLQEALTGQVYVDVTDTLGMERSEKIEPTTNYLTLRFQQDLNNANTVFGGFVTSMNRFGNDVNGLDEIHDGAQSFGVDLQQNFSDRKYGLELRLAGSQVNGSQQALLNTQRASERFFQRPDNNYRSIDSTRTNLRGTASRVSFGKQSGNFRWRVGVNHRSPGLELNDIGFLNQTDNINVWTWTQYRVLEEKGVFRSQFYNLNIERNYDFGGVNTYQGMGGNISFQFTNLWGFESGFWFDAYQVSNADLRGGPSFRYPGGFNWWSWIGTPSQKMFRFFINPSFYWGDDNYALNKRVRFGVTARPTDALRISIEPVISERRFDLQYVETSSFSNGDPAYILAQVKQKQFSMSMRANYNITPNLTLEFWGQPFMVNIQYDDYKRVTDPLAEQFGNRFIQYSDAQLVVDNDARTIGVYETGGADPDFTIGKPDFNIVEFRTNFVMRWEYIPGSTLFAVWSHNSSAFPDPTEVNDLRGLQDEFFGLRGNNTFVIKYTYRFIL